MKTIDEIRKEQERRLSALYKELGIFFAFSQSQFNEHKKEGVTYVDGGLGMIIPKKNVKTFWEKFDKLSNEIISEFNANVPMDDYIRYELANYECFYTGNYGTIIEEVQAYYKQCTIEDIKRVYYKYVNEEIQTKNKDYENIMQGTFCKRAEICRRDQ